MTEASKAAIFLRALPGTHRQRAHCERAAALMEEQARSIDKLLHLGADQSREILELRAQLDGVRAVMDPGWGVEG